MEIGLNLEFARTENIDAARAMELAAEAEKFVFGFHVIAHLNQPGRGFVSYAVMNQIAPLLSRLIHAIEARQDFLDGPCRRAFCLLSISNR